MYLADVALDDFRSFRHAVVRFHPGINILTGRNGRGKTNMVEAIAYLSTFSSHRVSADSALVRFPEPGEIARSGAVVRAKVVVGEHEKILEMEIVAGRANRARLNRNPVKTRELLGLVPTIVFAPEDLALVKGDPGIRRRFLDELVVQRYPAAASDRADLERVLRQRAALLRSAGQFHDKSEQLATLEIWNEQLVQLSARTMANRVKVLNHLRNPAARVQQLVSEDGAVLGLGYRASTDQYCPPAGGMTIERTDLLHLEDSITRLRNALQQIRAAEIARGVNLVGPHRDELELSLGSLPVRGFASHGESWSVALALRLGAFEILGGTDPDPSRHPVLILDDVFAELDQRRRAALVNYIVKIEQVFITVAVAADLPPDIKGARYLVEKETNTGSTIIEIGNDEAEVVDLTSTAEVITKAPAQMASADNALRVGNDSDE